MTIKEFMTANPKFIFGHKVEIMSKDEILEIYNRDKSSYAKGDAEYIRYYQDNRFIEKADDNKLYEKSFYASKPSGNRWLDSDSIEIIIGKDKSGWPHEVNLPTKFIKKVKSDKSPSDKLLDLINKVANLYDEKVFLCMSSCGEVHGSSDITPIIINDTIFPAFDYNGKECIMLQDCGYSHNRLSVDFVKKLLSKERVDDSIRTDMSFIRREYQLINESEVDEKTFSY
jgi:hypothetical protein